MLVFSVGSLLKKDVGTVEHHVLSDKLTFATEDAITTAGKAEGDVVLMNLGDEIHVEVKAAKLPVSVKCSRCLKPCTHVIHLPLSTREFFVNALEDRETRADNFLIDARTVSIDLSEMLRQDFLLHSPEHPVCSESCKGLCEACGTDLNKKTCACNRPRKEMATQKPFAPLQQLLRDE